MNAAGSRWRPPLTSVAGLVLLASVASAVIQRALVQAAQSYVPAHDHGTTLDPAQAELVAVLVGDVLALPAEILLESAVLLLAALALRPDGGVRPAVAAIRLLIAYAVFAVASFVGLLLVVPGVFIVLTAALAADPYRLLGHGPHPQRWRRSFRRGAVLGVGLVASAAAGFALPLVAASQPDGTALFLSALGSACWMLTLLAYAWFHQRP